MPLDKIWSDEGSRALEVLGGEPPKYKRTVEDKLTITFSLAEWKQLFNVDAEYAACDGEGKAYKENQPLNIYFVRKIVDERP